MNYPALPYLHFPTGHHLHATCTPPDRKDLMACTEAKARNQPFMTSHTPPAYDLSFLDEPNNFHLQPEPEPEAYADEPDPFADSQLDHIVEEIEMRSARTFNHSVDTGIRPTRQPKPFRRAAKQPDSNDAGQPRPHNVRSMLTIPLAIIAVIGLVVMLLVSHGSSPNPSVEIKIAPPATITYPPIVLPSLPPRIAPIRPVKLPPEPQPPAPANFDRPDPYTDSATNQPLAESSLGFPSSDLAFSPQPTSFSLTHSIPKLIPNRRLILNPDQLPTAHLTSTDPTHFHNAASTQ